MRSQLEDKEDDLSRARRATHNSNIERQEQAKALGELRGEMDELRDQLQQKQATVQVMCGSVSDCVCVLVSE